MGILDEINNMKNQGMDEREILSRLQEKGVTPKSIEEAFNQMRIKKAVSAESSGQEGMEPSIMKEGRRHEAEQASPLYIPKTKEIDHNHEELYVPNPQQSPQFNEELEAPKYENYNQEEYTPQEGYGEQEAGGYDTDTFIEIAEQVFSEKIKKEQKQIDTLNEFATIAETKLSNDHEKIKRIEEIIDKLQAAILEKVGSYGKNLDSIKNEMGMMQESFGKMVPSIHERTYGNKGNKEKERNYGNEEPAEEESEEENIPPVTRKKISKTKR